MSGRIRFFPAFLLSLCLVLLVGCGDSTSTAVPANTVAPTNTVAAPNMTAPAATAPAATTAPANTTAPATTAPAATTAPVSATTGASGQTDKFKGVEINILTFTGPQIAEPLQRRAPEFAAATGAKVNIVTVPYSDLYQKMLTDASTNTNSYQGYVFNPQWMADFATPGYLDDLTSKVKTDSTLNWNDILPFFRDFSSTYNGKNYTVPLDGDFHMAYYRTDLLQQAGLKPPQTWQEYVNIAKTFQGKDLNGDGTPDYGTCISMKRGAQAFWFIYDIAGAYLQTQGTSQGTFFDLATMKPLVNNDAFGQSLDIYKSLLQYSPPEALNQDVGDTRGLFTSGRCALSIDWGDIGTLALDPATSKVQDKVGAVTLPGTDTVWDRTNNKLVKCDTTTCPYAVNGINHSPYAASGGWSGAVNAAASQQQKDAAFAFLAYVSAPAQSDVDVTLGKTGFNPYRTSQFSSSDLWAKVGMSATAQQLYLGAIKDSLGSPNMILDLRIPQAQQYQQVVLDTAIAQFLAGEIDKATTMKQISDGWEQITDGLGRDKQLAAYKASLNVTR